MQAWFVTNYFLNIHHLIHHELSLVTSLKTLYNYRPATWSPSPSLDLTGPPEQLVHPPVGDQTTTIRLTKTIEEFVNHRTTPENASPKTRQPRTATTSPESAARDINRATREPIATSSAASPRRPRSHGNPSVSIEPANATHRSPTLNIVAI